MEQLIKELDEIVKDQEDLAHDTALLAKALREELEEQEPALIDRLQLPEPPPLDGELDPRVENLYHLLWDHREDVLARLYEPERIYIGRALYKLLLEVPPQSRVTTASLLEAAKGRFFQHIRGKWSRVRIEVVPTGAGDFQTVVKSTDVLLTGILREMRGRGLLDEIEASAQ